MNRMKGQFKKKKGEQSITAQLIAEARAIDNAELKSRADKMKEIS